MVICQKVRPEQIGSLLYFGRNNTGRSTVPSH
jgi:hypothetical protein